ncbi:MAG: patatin-like protein [Deltaproteobacteria bacterium]|nr:patatin-like protein [Deltaproteobacteria bacterium]
MEEEVKGNESVTDEDASREVRIALVLYGGVSLAVYENGVTRAFFDLVKGRGIFKLILKLLDARAVVDVIAGSSAGGINGLLLAAALEAGSEFGKTAKLWREHGDLGVLMRPVSKAQNAESLLDGEHYYQERLEEAFKELLEDGQASEVSSGEMDVFITGTDLAGHINTWWDTLGQEIEDKSHRVVFQLKYRPGRRRIGLNPEEGADLKADGAPCSKKDKRLMEKQATILASIARITSTFPVAFPPFRLDQIQADHREEVQKALEWCGGLKDLRNLQHVYVDGGVLNNKPFGPVVRAIFYRVPYGIVDRRLFYVEPDPEHFTQLTKQEEGKLGNPVGTALASLTTIPSHQSIFEDLDRLREHNARIGWLKGLKAKIAGRLGKSQDLIEAPVQEQAYWETRIESIVRSLLLEIDAVPSAGDHIAPSARDLCEDFRNQLISIRGTPRGEEQIAGCDIDFHLRRAFHFLYKMYDAFQKGGGDPEKTKIALKATSRIVKLLKLGRDLLFSLRDNILPVLVRSGKADALDVLKRFQRFLSSDRPAWKSLCEELWKVPPLSVQDLGNRETGPISSRALSEAAEAARREDSAETNMPAEAAEATSTILQVIEQVLKRVVSEWCGSNSCFEQFEALDRVFFPLEFTCGIHELDEIKLVRISPSDAKTGLSALAPEKKVTGDDLAHFAAFFRRDWRSNDLLWGRVDGICQIICSLLDDEAFKRISSQGQGLAKLMTPAYLDTILQDCPQTVRQQLDDAWTSFLTELNKGTETSQKAAFKQFGEKLILCGQHEAVNQDLKGLYEDIYFQEISWGTCGADGTLAEAANPVLVSDKAKKLAAESMKEKRKADRGECLRDMAMGSQTVFGENGQVPMKILGQYITQAYVVLWGMLEGALGGPRNRWNFFSHKKVKLVLRFPVLLMHRLIRMMRKERRITLSLLGALTLVLFSSGITGFILNRWLNQWWFLLLLGLSFVPVVLGYWFYRHGEAK